MSDVDAIRRLEAAVVEVAVAEYRVWSGSADEAGSSRPRLSPEFVNAVESYLAAQERL